MLPDSIPTTHAARIRDLHAEAHRLADAAIDRAVEAGRLLAEVKSALPHGEFGSWVATHCGFSDRTARRYLRLHAHRETLPSGLGVKAALEHLKTDTVSELKHPGWLPLAGLAVTCSDGRGRTWHAWAIDFIAHDGERQNIYAHAMVMTDTSGSDGLVEYTGRAIRFDYLADTLRDFGLRDPGSAKWTIVDAAVPEAMRMQLVAMDRAEVAQ